MTACINPPFPISSLRPSGRRSVVYPLEPNALNEPVASFCKILRFFKKCLWDKLAKFCWLIGKKVSYLWSFYVQHILLCMSVMLNWSIKSNSTVPLSTIHSSKLYPKEYPTHFSSQFLNRACSPLWCHSFLDQREFCALCFLALASYKFWQTFHSFFFSKHIWFKFCIAFKRIIHK
jgi:hypothetical protein